MGKFFGEIGYFEHKEVAPDVWDDVITTRTYSGNFERNVVKVRDGENLNKNTFSDNRLSIVSDKYAYENFHRIRWVMYMGVKWEVLSAEIRHPRILITMGGVYNDQQRESNEA